MLSDQKHNIKVLSSLLDDMEAAEAAIPRLRIGEREFVSQWLPRFWYYGQINPQTGKPVVVNLAPWYVNISQGIYNEVDVFNDATGEVLFTVPPLSPKRKPSLSTLSYTMGGVREKMPVATIIANASNSFNRRVNIAQAERDVNSIGEFFTGDKSLEDDLVSYYAQWDAIFDRYVKDRKRWSANKATEISTVDSGFEEDDEQLI